MPKQWAGQFVVIHWPYTDQTNSKRRPALVLEEPDGQGDRQPDCHLGTGELLDEEFLHPLGVSQYRLTKAIDVPASRISECPTAIWLRGALHL